jgi:hypothetical protein
MGVAKKTKPEPRPLPAALAKRAGDAAEKKRDRDKAEAADLVGIIHRRRDRIAEDFYDIGVALAKLREARLYRALGYARFADLVEHEVGVSDTQAYKLIAITEHLTRERAVELGQEKAAALVQLAAATPERDTATTLGETEIVVGGKRRKVDPATLSVSELREAAKRERKARAPKNERSEAAREGEAIAKRCQAALRKAGFASAVVKVVMVRREGAAIAELRLSGVPAVEHKKIGRALAGA